MRRESEDIDTTTIIICDEIEAIPRNHVNFLSRSCYESSHGRGVFATWYATSQPMTRIFIVTLTLPFILISSHGRGVVATWYAITTTPLPIHHSSHPITLLIP